MIQLTVYVNDIDTVISVFTHIRLYTSDQETGTYTHLDYIPLVAGQSTYEYTHVAGNSSTWYKSSYWSASTESSLSTAVQGSDSQLFHYSTYPTEVDFSTAEQDIIRKIRRLVGDLKKLERIYSDGTEFCSSIVDDNKTISLGEKGWPVYISIDDTEYTSSTNPHVQGYQYLTFSGSLISGSQNPIIDLWFYTFKLSDVEVYRAYSDSMIPPGLTTDTVTQDHLILQSAIDILENFTWEDMVDDGARIGDDQTIYDPSPGIKERDAAIKRLRKQLDALVRQYIFSSMTGILID